jgi:hypothetical protein
MGMGIPQVWVWVELLVSTGLPVPMPSLQQEGARRRLHYEGRLKRLRLMEISDKYI